MHELVVCEAMKMSLLMVTFRKDLEFTVYAMRSVEKFATGFFDKIVVVPELDVAVFKAPAQKYGWRVVGFDERPGCGMLHHMVKILEADLICDGADYVLHMDADCLFTAPVTPADYLKDDKPIVLRQRYEEFRNSSSRYSWKTCVRNATGIDPEWETMCRHPSVYRTDLYPVVRDMITQHTVQDWAEYILGCRNVYPQTFAEFPTLGAVAIHCHADKYAWCDVSHDLIPESKMTAYWSHGGLEMVNDRHPGRTARQAMEAVLA
jgi:hypothetical protein